MSKIKGIFVHHSVYSRQTDQFNIIDQQHKKQWGFRSSLGYYGGYNTLIEKSGIEKYYRAEGERTAAQKYYNVGYLSTCLAGNFEIQKLTPEQDKALKATLRRWRAKYNLPKTSVKMHREVKATLCPGKNLAIWLEDYRTKNNLKEDIQVQIEEVKKLIDYLWKLLRAIDT